MRRRAKRTVYPVVALWAALTGASATPSAQTRSDLQVAGLTGPVHIVKGETTTGRRVNGRIVEEGTPRPVDTVTYDSSGMTTEQDIIDDYGFPVGKQTFRYERARLVETVLRDPAGKALERREFSYSGSRDAPETLTITGADGEGYVERYTRDANGRLTRITYLVRDIEMGRTEFTYGDGAEPGQIAFFLPTGVPATAPVGPCLGAHRVVFRYKDGQIEERTLFEADGELKRRSVFRYDKAGNVISEARSSAFGQDRFTYEYDYDRRGNWVVRRWTSEYRVDREPNQASDGIVYVTRRSLTYR